MIMKRCQLALLRIQMIADKVPTTTIGSMLQGQGRCEEDHLMKISSLPAGENRQTARHFSFVFRSNWMLGGAPLRCDQHVKLI
jgi:hypothetical protein